MKFLVDWEEEAPNRVVEEEATLCSLEIFVGGDNSCRHWDDSAGSPVDSVVVPAVHLAEGIAADWWKIFGGRDIRHSILPYRTGFILPCLSFGCDGDTFEVSFSQSDCRNPGVAFGGSGSEVLPRADAEMELSGFVDNVSERLAGKRIWESEVQIQWSRVKESRQDPDEAEFCEAAGALGLDPYNVGEDDARFIELAGTWFTGVALIEFVAGLRDVGVARRQEILAGLDDVISRRDPSAELPDLPALSGKLPSDIRDRRPGEGAWGPGYRLAQAFRRELGFEPGAEVDSIRSLAGGLGNHDFKATVGLPGVGAVLSRRDSGAVSVHLGGLKYPAPWSQTFNLARAVGDAVCYRDDSFFVVNRLHGAKRQAVGRAFAAELLAPADEVRSMATDGYDVPDIAGRFKVSERVVAHQLDNYERVVEACSL